MEDTIAAVSTALGVGAISIIRVSGPEAVKIVNKIFNGKDLERVKSHTIHYGHVYDPKNDKIIDELKNKKIVILGFGMEGKSSYRFIRKYLDWHSSWFLLYNEK